MKISEIQLPSNKQFGFFFALIFSLAATYLYYTGDIDWAYVCSAVALVFIVIALVKSDLLLGLNMLWMRFGFVLSVIISPVVLGLIFFGLFTPIAMFMRVYGRDELRLKVLRKESHWISRNRQTDSESFKNQF